MYASPEERQNFRISGAGYGIHHEQKTDIHTEIQSTSCAGSSHRASASVRLQGATDEGVAVAALHQPYPAGKQFLHYWSWCAGRADLQIGNLGCADPQVGKVPTWVCQPQVGKVPTWVCQPQVGKVPTWDMSTSRSAKCPPGICRPPGRQSAQLGYADPQVGKCSPGIANPQVGKCSPGICQPPGRQSAHLGYANLQVGKVPTWDMLTPQVGKVPTWDMLTPQVGKCSPGIANPQVGKCSPGICQPPGRQSAHLGYADPQVGKAPTWDVPTSRSAKRPPRLSHTFTPSPVDIPHLTTASRADSCIIPPSRGYCECRRSLRPGGADCGCIDPNIRASKNACRAC